MRPLFQSGPSARAEAALLRLRNGAGRDGRRPWHGKDVPVPDLDVSRRSSPKPVRSVLRDVAGLRPLALHPVAEDDLAGLGVHDEGAAVRERDLPVGCGEDEGLVHPLAGGRPLAGSRGDTAADDVVPTFG